MQTGLTTYAFIQYIDIDGAMRAKRKMDRQYIGQNRLKVSLVSIYHLRQNTCFPKRGIRKWLQLSSGYVQLDILIKIWIEITSYGYGVKLY